MLYRYGNRLDNRQTVAARPGGYTLTNEPNGDTTGVETGRSGPSAGGLAGSGARRGGQLAVGVLGSQPVFDPVQYLLNFTSRVLVIEEVNRPAATERSIGRAQPTLSLRCRPDGLLRTTANPLRG